MKKNYLDVVANAFQEAKAWKFASLVLSLVCGGLAFGLVYESRNAPVVLVPYNFASDKGTITVKPNGVAGETSPEYLAQTALGDLSTVLNWTPEDVEIQHQRFLNRMTPELYAEQNVKLMQEATDFKTNTTTESFYPVGTRVDGPHNQVIVDGTLVRWTGEKETLRLKVTYTITYAPYKGYLHVAGLQIKK